VYSGSPKYK